METVLLFDSSDVFFMRSSTTFCDCDIAGQLEQFVSVNLKSKEDVEQT
jgi:hypothetical protein